MARIAGIPVRNTGLLVKIAYRFTRRNMAHLVGRERADDGRHLVDAGAA